MRNTGLEEAWPSCPSWGLENASGPGGCSLAPVLGMRLSVRVQFPHLTCDRSKTREPLFSHCITQLVAEAKPYLGGGW